ncbi:MAG TPA: aminotransferase class I/II-fold pyridoxal phosphate-dependent enzyme [Kofleriaceae bacterium]|jgi:dTDP-4-amino-4,6-dideoxygalactose transaminase|nr:aminotransferase class I/II-fold pyridoxal phosphate-dependent enzyme [Kofleriaceae bacterium]
MDKSVRSIPWPTYDKGNVFVDDEDLRAPRKALENRLYFRYDYRQYSDTETGRFEAALRRYLGVEHTLAVSSGTAAIALGLMSLQLEPGSLVACPGFTFAATPSAILLAGCQPLLIECDHNLHLDVADLERKMSSAVRAIVVVHMRGFASDMPAILALARRWKVPVVEDAVPSLGVVLGGKHTGTFGAAGAFSTQSDKSLNTGEGGFLVCQDATQFARAVVLSGAYEGRFRRHFAGAVPEICDLDYPLFSFRMDEIRAALACAEMARLPRRLEVLRTNYEHVAGQLAEIDRIALREPTSPGAFLGDALVLRLPHASAEQVVQVAAALRREGVDARALGAPNDLNVRCFWNWRFLFKGMSATEIRALLPATAQHLSHAIDIPMSPTLTRADCDDLIRAVRKVLHRRSSSHAAELRPTE